MHRQNANVQVETGGHLNLGVAVGDRCLSPILWSGIIAADTVPYIAGFALKLHVVDVSLYDYNHQKSMLLERGFDLIKSSLIPALETYSYDLTPAIQELEGLAQMAVTDQAALHLALATMHLEPAVIADESGLRLTLAIDLPLQAPSAPITSSAAPLKPEEIAAWNNALDNWDAFLVFAIKQVGATVTDANVRNQLLNILLDSRQQLVAALSQPQRLNGPDPVRLLFLREWTRLGQLIDNAARQGRLGNRSLEFLSFISAGDALFALDQVASELGMRISADDLRRLARIMAPQASGDPLAYSFDEDPELRRLFDLSTPLELPGALELPIEPAPSATSDRSDEFAPGEADRASIAPSISAASRRPETSSPNAPSTVSINTSLLVAPFSISPSGLCLLTPATVYAADVAPGTQENAVEILTLGRKLHAVVVSEHNESPYRYEINRLLDLTAQYQLQDDAAEASVQRLWPILLKAVAWQESCWRQFVIKHRRVWYLESQTGDIGLMQVNKYVWRGFYSLARLQWDIVYNLSAGTEILQRFLTGASGHFHSDDPVALARATYAAYNGGPNAYNRWRQPLEPPALRAIDQAFWLKYRAIEAGQAFDILSCAVQWDHSHSN
ncbi:MAG: lytic transglycosylase domain-containing protein [Deltaproteobacteria bacterium]|nr:lytic transglycosylase domain-containing protein [Deltaproteobacteria bacterium]